MLRCLLLVILLAASLHAQEHTYPVSFHSVNGIMLLDGTVNGKPAVLLFDTGVDFTLISLEASGLTAKLDALKATKTMGANGE